MNELSALGPLDGRYKDKVAELSAYFSEAGLIRHRIKMEIEYLIALSQLKSIGLREITKVEQEYLRSLPANHDAPGRVKTFEAKINHDVKAVEYYIKEEMKMHPSLKDSIEWVHFALTSEDCNNIAYATMLSGALSTVILPALNQIKTELERFATAEASTAILARTHGQAASPTTLGKEFKVFAARLSKQIKQLETLRISAKLNGATGNYNAHHIAYPEINWLDFSQNYISSLSDSLKIKLEANLYTTQIEPHDTYAELFDILRRINTILVDFNQDIWRYISDGWLVQRANPDEVGSSAMPHKVNPIDFENSEGNLGLANALAQFFSTKLPISRLQRDLSDSTVLRNMGLAFGYSLVAYKSLLKGLSKIAVNQVQIQAELDKHVEVLAEAIQTVLRREGMAVPYEQLKELTRGKQVTIDDLRNFVNKLSIKPEVKAKLNSLTPATYIGLASQLAAQQAAAQAQKQPH